MFLYEQEKTMVDRSKNVEKVIGSRHPALTQMTKDLPLISNGF
jgi:hypothetical protein